jgi:hypothetical protein
MKLPIKLGEVTVRVRPDKWLVFWLNIIASRVSDFLWLGQGDLLREAAWRSLGLEVAEETEE